MVKQSKQNRRRRGHCMLCGRFLCNGKKGGWNSCRAEMKFTGRTRRWTKAQWKQEWE